MKNKLILFFISLTVLPIQCEYHSKIAPRNNQITSKNIGLNKNPKTQKYFSVPFAKDINQNVYHDLVMQCKGILSRYQNNNRSSCSSCCEDVCSFDPNMGKNEVRKHLRKINNPSAIRLLKDLEKINFAIR